MNLRHLFTIVYLITLSSCGVKNNKIDHHIQSKLDENYAFFEDTDKVFSYQSKSNEKILKKCALEVDFDKTCRVDELPFIGYGKNKITIDDILNKTLVSHKEYGDNLKAALKILDNKILLDLFGAATAIVISDKINPSFYYPVNSVIFLSGRYLWTSENIKELSYKKIDHRGKNISKANWTALNYGIYSTMVKDGKSIWYSTSQSKRTVEDLKYPLFRVLVHELTHANEYYPKSFYSKLTPKDTSSSLSKILDIIIDQKKFLSHSLIKISDDQDLYDYALVNSLKLDLKDTNLESFDAIEMALKFSISNVNELYNFTTPHEDFAMLIEDYISLGEFGIERKSYVETYPQNGFVIPENYVHKIAWGSTNKILSSSVLKRAEAAIEKIFPGFDTKKYYDEKLIMYKHTESFMEKTVSEFLKE